MLSSLKDKILNVKKNVPLFSGSEPIHAQPKLVNSSAGCEILSHFQEEWEVLHAANEDNAKAAEEVANVISAITKKVERDKESLSLMSHLLLNSNLKTNIINCTRQIEVLRDSFNKIDSELEQLEDLLENVEFEIMKKQHRYHLRQYKEKREESVEMSEAIFREKYEKEVLEFEESKKKELQERQQVFQEAFKNDLEVFKSLGTIPKLDLPRKQPSALLEEIQVDYDENELDQFFGSTT